MLSHTRIGIELEKFRRRTSPKCWEQLCAWGVWTHWQPTWSSINLHSKSSLPYSFTPDDWQQCWWMQLRLALSYDESAVGKTSSAFVPMDSIRTQSPSKCSLYESNYSLLTQKRSLETSRWRCSTKSTPTHWLLLEATYSKYMPLLEWWIEIVVTVFVK